MLLGLGDPSPCIQLFSCVAWLKKSLPVGKPPPVVKLPPVASEYGDRAAAAASASARRFRSSLLCAGDCTADPPFPPLPGVVDALLLAASSAAAMNSAAALFSAREADLTTLAGDGHFFDADPPGVRPPPPPALAAVIFDVGDSSRSSRASSDDSSEVPPVRTLIRTGEGDDPRPNHDFSTLISSRLSALWRNSSAPGRDDAAPSDGGESGPVITLRFSEDVPRDIPPASSTDSARMRETRGFSRAPGEISIRVLPGDGDRRRNRANSPGEDAASASSLGSSFASPSASVSSASVFASDSGMAAARLAADGERREPSHCTGEPPDILCCASSSSPSAAVPPTRRLDVDCVGAELPKDSSTPPRLNALAAAARSSRGLVRGAEPPAIKKS